MNTTARYEQDGIALTLRKSLRNGIRYHRLLAPWAQGEQVDAIERGAFAFVAAHVEAVTGLDWTPPALGASEKQIEKSYQQFLDAVPDIATLNALYDLVNGLYAPIADEVQRPNETLTPEQQADPN